MSRLIKPSDITKQFLKKATQFHGIFHGLKITNLNSVEKRFVTDFDCDNPSIIFKSELLFFFSYQSMLSVHR